MMKEFTLNPPALLANLKEGSTVDKEKSWALRPLGRTDGILARSSGE